MTAEVQWKVTWFPDDTPEKTYTTFDEDNARARYDELQADGFAPILESREISEWQVVENATAEEIMRGKS
jgi:hypothetical protein